MKPIPPAPPIEKKNTALGNLHKKRDEIQQAMSKTPAKNPVELPMNDQDEGESSYWESDAKSASQWSSSVVWSSWSKLEKNRAGQLPPLETSVVKNKPGNQDSSAKKPLKESSPDPRGIDINVNRMGATPVPEDNVSPNKKKKFKKKKTRKANKLQSDAGGD